MANYFNTLNLRQQLAQLGKCRFMARDEFADGASYLQGKSGHRRLRRAGSEPGLNMRDSGPISPMRCAKKRSPRSAPPA